MSTPPPHLLHAFVCTYTAGWKSLAFQVGIFASKPRHTTLNIPWQLSLPGSYTTTTSPTRVELHRKTAMSARDDLEISVRRTLTFYLEGEGAAGESNNQELLVSALLDAAESGTLRAAPDVETQFDDYLPDASLAPPQRDGLYDDLLRCGV